MPRWRVIVSRIGKVPLDWRKDCVLDRSGCVFEKVVDEPGRAFRVAAEMLHAQDHSLTPSDGRYLQIHMEDGANELTVLSDYVRAEVEWPFPAFFWRWVDQFSASTRARLDPETTASVIGVVAKWAVLGKKIRLVFDDERRGEVKRLVLALLPVIPDLGLGEADKGELYLQLARVAWLAAQPDMVLTGERQRALDVVLSTISDLIQPAR